MTLKIAASLILMLSTACVANADWLRFRGPNGSGVSEDTVELPTRWSKGENTAWKVALPGAGVSSPIIVGDKVFVTCYSGYGLDRQEPGEIENLKRHLVCLDADTGKIIWDKSVKATLPEDPYTGIGVPSHGYASHTPVSDGERVYTFFGKSGAVAFDMDGNQLWQTNVGKESDQRRWGSSSSPIVFENVLIVTASAESEALVGLDTKTGKELWRKEASGLANVWGTPALANVGDRTDVVLGVPFEIWGFDPLSGKFRWYCEAVEADQFSTSVIVNDGIVFGMASSRGGGGAVAIEPEGSGDITKSAVLWSGDESARFSSPIVHDGLLYAVDGSIANCFDAETGDKIYQSRLQRGAGEPEPEERGGRGGFGRGGRGGPDGGGPGGGGPGGGRGGPGGGRGGRGGGGGDFSSPVAGDGKLYFVSGSGAVYVLKLGEKFEQLAVNQMGDGEERFGGSPAISKGALYFRSDKHLYKVGK